MHRNRYSPEWAESFSDILADSSPQEANIQLNTVQEKAKEHEGIRSHLSGG